MTDPLGNIEEKHGQRSVGALVVNIYEGALAESGSRRNAFWATVAWAVAANKSTEDTTDEGDE
jgi:hypothetical protein